MSAIPHTTPYFHTAFTNGTPALPAMRCYLHTRIAALVLPGLLLSGTTRLGRFTIDSARILWTFQIYLFLPYVVQTIPYTNH